MTTRLYLDVCCLNRPRDDQSQDRIRPEAEAILMILERIQSGEWSWVGSEVMELEIEDTPDPERRDALELMMRSIGSRIIVGDEEYARAQRLEGMGFHAFDALHLACAESAAVDVFLTTDDRLQKRASRLASDLHLRVENPLTWLRETTSP